MPGAVAGEFDGAGVKGRSPLFVSVNGRIVGVNGIIKFSAAGGVVSGVSSYQPFGCYSLLEASRSLWVSSYKG